MRSYRNSCLKRPNSNPLELVDSVLAKSFFVFHELLKVRVVNTIFALQQEQVDALILWHCYFIYFSVSYCAVSQEAY